MTAAALTGLPTTASGAPTARAATEIDCTLYEQTNVSLCGQMRDKFVAMGGPSGQLGAPTRNEEATTDGIGRRVTFQNNAMIYWSPRTGAHVISGPILKAWKAAGAERSEVGYPISDEIANTGTYARFGERRNDFENGAVYSKNGDAVIGAWSSSKPASMALGPGAAQPETCPAGTTAYPGALAIYNCLVVDKGTDEYPNAIREGKPDPVPGNVAPDGDPSIEGFGRAHADVDHNVGLRALRLMVRTVPGQFLTRRPELNRFRHVNVFRVAGRPVEGLAVVVQRLPDTENKAPDRYDFGLITGYCSDGTDPGVPGTPHPGGRCPRDLPAPFGKQTGGA